MIGRTTSHPSRDQEGLLTEDSEREIGMAATVTKKSQLLRDNTAQLLWCNMAQPQRVRAMLENEHSSKVPI